ncbi:hypothetical protein [Salinimicrobium sp. WS361]|uniref:hypothetical protein n=1 Tax=Salinimicrobium sp. WS361 TaxID=3425123 RepID=UPI003D6E636F
MKKILLIINIAALIAALIWLKNDTSWEPLVASLGLIGALITQIFNSKKTNETTTMNQKGGKNSKNYQSNRDINITNND